MRIIYPIICLKHSMDVRELIETFFENFESVQNKRVFNILKNCDYLSIIFSLKTIQNLNSPGPWPRACRIRHTDPLFLGSLGPSVPLKS